MTDCKLLAKHIKTLEMINTALEDPFTWNVQVAKILEDLIAPYEQLKHEYDSKCKRKKALEETFEYLNSLSEKEFNELMDSMYNSDVAKALISSGAFND